MAAVCCMAASAEAPQRKMLEQSKTWVYVYHHFEEREDHTDYDHTMWLMNYVLEGDTVIDNRQYMKMYRHDERNWNDKKYYAAFREDEEGRVYVYYKNSNDEFKLIDFSFDYEEVEASQPAILSETIKVNGQLFHRYLDGTHLAHLRTVDAVGGDDYLFQLHRRGELNIELPVSVKQHCLVLCLIADIADSQ